MAIGVSNQCMHTNREIAPLRFAIPARGAGVLRDFILKTGDTAFSRR